jgi:NADPH-dependent curcumin reductase CurA
VSGFLGVQDYATVDAADLTVLDAALAPPEVHLGRLGMPALTAYFGLLDVGRAKAGDTVVVSGAAGAVGTVVGQLAKLKGCRVVGIAGGPSKCTYITEKLGFDAAIDYKSANVIAELHEHCPDGIDVYFDNVGGDVLDAALTRLALGARVVVCGAISLYAAAELKGPRYYLALLTQRATMAGFLVFDFAERFPEARRELAGWYADGVLTSHEHVVSGLEQFPESLRMLFEGGNTGKLVLALA